MSDTGKLQKAGGFPSLPSIPNIPGVGALGSIPGAPSIPGLPQPPSIGNIQSSGKMSVAKFFQEGFTVGWGGLLFLAGILPFQPFVMLGYSGMNLLAVGAMAWAAGKAALQGICTLVSKYIDVYYPSLSFYSAFFSYNPWYIFDILQMFSPAFNEEGYKVPFLHTPVGGEGSTGTINATMLGLMVSLLSAGCYALVQKLPKEVVSTAKPTLDLVFTGLGSVAALSAGGLGAAMVLPEIMKSAKGSLSEIKSAVAAPAPSGAVSGATTSGAVSAPQAQKGGGLGNPGSVFPDLRQIADGMLGPAIAGDPSAFQSRILNGGGKRSGKSEPTDGEMLLFLGALSVVAVGGLTLAAVRAKAIPEEPVESSE
jgi:hypothetical protein